VNAARWRLGAMLGGDEGDALRREAQEFFGARGVARSQQLIDAIMPGWGRG
jgi:hypothetical protein